MTAPRSPDEAWRDGWEAARKQAVAVCEAEAEGHRVSALNYPSNDWQRRLKGEAQESCHVAGLSIAAMEPPDPVYERCRRIGENAVAELVALHALFLEVEQRMKQIAAAKKDPPK